MSQCIAYRALTGPTVRLKRCKGRAEVHSQFCRSHILAICGAYLGLCVSGVPEGESGKSSPTSPKVDRSTLQ